ncbi:MAG: ElyC/SanA/YdcF family protein [Peptococcaceae bacterium MAG4]|nr:ElyC/SanA/YdcF family protein [Peptococcaceae bacterium MAG4]
MFVLLALIAGVTAVDRHVKTKGLEFVVDAQDCPVKTAAIVPGAYVSPEGRLCDMLADRVKTAVELYQNNRVKKIIMSGDHGRKDYDEVNYMRLYAEKMGVSPEDIFMDHAGFSTYDSIYRAKAIFQVDTAVVVTQAYHLPRALYAAYCLGIDACGVAADKHVYAGARLYELREVPARLKMFAQIHLLNAKPRFLGKVIPVSGDGRLTYDWGAKKLEGFLYKHTVYAVYG